MRRMTSLPIGVLTAVLATWTTPAWAAELSPGGVAAWVEAEGGRVSTGSGGRIAGVDLTSSWVNDDGLAKLATLEDLEVLVLAHTKISDVGLEYLKPLENVRELDLYYAEYITDSGIAHLKGWQKLERLDVRGSKVTSRLLEHLTGFKRLKSLDIGFSRVTDDGFEHLNALPSLESFAFGGNKMSGVSLPLLKLLPSLKALDVSGLQRTDSGLWGLALSDFNVDAIATLTGLQELNISHMQVSDRSLARLAPLENLEVLRLDSTPVTGRGIRALARLGKLRFLTLAHAARIDDEAAEALAGLTGLESLDLSGTAVSDRALAPLAAAPRLRELFVGETAVTREAVEAFRQSHPDWRVDWWPKVDRKSDTDPSEE